MSELMLDVGTANEIKLAMRRAGFTGADVKAVSEGDFMSGVLGLIRGEYVLTKVPQTTCSTIVVSSIFTLSNRIALGNYGWVNSDINEKRFPHDPSTIGEWEYDLYHPDCSVSSEDVKSGAEVDGWTVAKAEHLLAFGESFPEEQRKYPVIAIGSVCEVRVLRRILALWRDDSKRSLGLYGWGGGWLAGCRFLRVRKIQPSNN